MQAFKKLIQKVSMRRDKGQKKPTNKFTSEYDMKVADFQDTQPARNVIQKRK